MKVLQEEILKVIQYETDKELKAHAAVMIADGYTLEKHGWRYGKFNAIYKKYIV